MRAISVKPASMWSGEPSDRVVLDYDGRHRRRLAMTGANGTAFVLDLPATAELRGGDALVLEDGRLIEIEAAAEPLLEIHCADALHLACVAWHLGNRHAPVQLLRHSLRIRHDHVLADMARQLGACLIEISAPFDPEGGAYAASMGHHRHDTHNDNHRGQHEHDHG